MIHSEPDVDDRVILLSVVNTEANQILNSLKFSLVIICDISVFIFINQLDDAYRMGMLNLFESLVRLI